MLERERHCMSRCQSKRADEEKHTQFLVEGVLDFHAGQLSQKKLISRFV